MSAIHIYTSLEQPATRFADHSMSEPGKRRYFFRHHPREQLWCHGCHRRRWAVNLVAKVYYDCTQFYCRAGRGCKVPGVVRR